MGSFLHTLMGTNCQLLDSEPLPFFNWVTASALPIPHLNLGAEGTVLETTTECVRVPLIADQGRRGTYGKLSLL